VIGPFAAPVNALSKAMSRRHQARPESHARPLPGNAVTRTSGGGGAWLWGVHPVLAALANPKRHCRRLVATSEAQRSQGTELASLLSQRRLVAETMERSGIDALLPAGALHQGLALAVEPLPDLAVADLVAATKDLERAVVMVLDQVTDPHNLGAVMRSAAAFGAKGVIVTERHAPGETGTLAKAASGALERMPLVRAVNLARALDELKEAGFWVAGLAADAPVTVAKAKLSGRVALVLGAEGEGMRRLTREHCDLLVRLPQTDAVESLNVSNAAAVALYEIVRDSLG
jgi:23S rRNA (guanosine2251-2'-O)-methyltransferase